MAGESQALPDSAPDPTVLTTDSIARAMRAERDWTESQLEVLRERLRGIDRATKLLDEDMHRVPTETQQAVGHLREVMDEKFTTVAIQFRERDTRQEREARDAKTAVDAAFAASKEATSEQNKSNTLAINKSEVASGETIRKLAELLQAETKSISGTIDEVKERISRLELRVSGSESSIAGGRESAAETRAIADRQEDIKDTIRRLEARILGSEDRKAGGKEQLTAIYALVGFFAVVLVLGTALAAAGVFG